MNTLVPAQDIEKRIFLIRGHKVMIDRDLARLYGVSTMALNQAVKRNKERFPEDFLFRLTRNERDEIITVCDRLRPLKYAPTLPNAFTENGVAMLSSALRSHRAILVNVQIMRTFTRLRQLISTHHELAQKLNTLEHKVKSHDRQIRAIFDAIRELIVSPEKRRPSIGFRH